MIQAFKLSLDVDFFTLMHLFASDTKHLPCVLCHSDRDGHPKILRDCWEYAAPSSDDILIVRA